MVKSHATPKQTELRHRLRPHPRTIAARFTALLLLTVAVFMGFYGWWFSRWQRRILTNELQRNAEVLATTLSSLISVAASVETEVVAELVAPAADSTRFRVVVYDHNGLVTFPAGGTGRASPDALSGVLDAERAIQMMRSTSFADSYAVLTRITAIDGTVLGALELQASTDASRASVRTLLQHFSLATLLLFVAVAVTTVLMVRRVVATPLRRLRDGVAAVSGGNLSHRIDTAGVPRELLDVSEDFNEMADALESAREKEHADAEERLALEHTIQQSKQLAAVGQLASGLAHQIAAPLNVIAGRTELVLKRAVANQDREDLATVLRQITRITTTVGKLFDVARRPPPAMTVGSLHTLVAEALDFLASELSDLEITVEQSVPENTVVTVDRPQMLDVIEIIVLNALHAMESRENRQLGIEAHPEASEVILDITDTGTGIAPDKVDQIFDPFFSTREGGTGLGLMIARDIVEAHGGTITATNRPDQRGARFRIRLPIRSAAPHASDSTSGDRDG